MANNLHLGSKFNHKIKLNGDIPKKLVIYSNFPHQDKYLKFFIRTSRYRFNRYSKSNIITPILFIKITIDL